MRNLKFRRNPQFLTFLLNQQKKQNIHAETIRIAKTSLINENTTVRQILNLDTSWYNQDMVLLHFVLMTLSEIEQNQICLYGSKF